MRVVRLSGLPWIIRVVKVLGYSWLSAALCVFPCFDCKLTSLSAIVVIIAIVVPLSVPVCLSLIPSRIPILIITIWSLIILGLSLIKVTCPKWISHHREKPNSGHRFVFGMVNGIGNGGWLLPLHWYCDQTPVSLWFSTVWGSSLSTCFRTSSVALSVDSVDSCAFWVELVSAKATKLFSLQAISKAFAMFSHSIFLMVVTP